MMAPFFAGDSRCYMKKIIIYLFLLIAIMGCTSRKQEQKKNPLMGQPHIIKGITVAYIYGDISKIKRIPKSRLKNVSSESSTKDIVSILGPGYLYIASGLGNSTWHFDDGNMLIISPNRDNINKKPHYFDIKEDFRSKE